MSRSQGWTAEDWLPIIQFWRSYFNLPANNYPDSLIIALMIIESSFNPSAANKNQKNIGLLQQFNGNLQDSSEYMVLHMLPATENLSSKDFYNSKFGKIWDSPDPRSKFLNIDDVDGRLASSRAEKTKKIGRAHV